MDVSSESLKSHAKSMLDGINQSWNCGDYADTTVHGLNGSKVKCHRLVLSSVSKLLHSVFKDLASEEENETCVILPDMDENEITILLQFLYTGSVDLESNHQHVLKVLKTLEVPISYVTEGCSINTIKISEENQKNILLSCTPLQSIDGDSEPALIENVFQLNNSNRFCCDTCDRDFESRDLLTSHVLRDHKLHVNSVDVSDIKFQCELCDYACEQRTDLDTHINNHHKDMICDLCNKLCTSLDNLTRHKSTHRAAKNFKCSKCEELFRWRAEYRRHAETVHGQKITDMTTCNICHKQIVSKRLNEHIKSVHGNEKPFPCKQCDKRFAKPSELRNHTRTHTGERPFECNICGASFSYSHILTRHKRYHEGAKKFTCSVCSKSFLQRNDLVKHLRIHSGEKPYKCGLCGKDFARMDYLKKHQMLHSTETKFCCSDCGELCGSVDGLKKHKKHSHSKDNSNIEFNSFDDLALQLPNISSIGHDNVLENISELQAVSLDGGKTIMILNESENSIYTEVHMDENYERSTGDTYSQVNSENGSTLEANNKNFDSYVEPAEVFYAVEY